MAAAAADETFLFADTLSTSLPASWHPVILLGWRSTGNNRRLKPTFLRVSRHRGWESVITRRDVALVTISQDKGGSLVSPGGRWERHLKNQGQSEGALTELLIHWRTLLDPRSPFVGTSRVEWCAEESGEKGDATLGCGG